MPEDERVTTFCPRCGKPIVWERHPTSRNTDELVIVGWLCFCGLDDDEWAELSEQAAAAFDARQR